jgi:hypothetical protein
MSTAAVVLPAIEDASAEEEAAQPPRDRRAESSFVRVLIARAGFAVGRAIFQLSLRVVAPEHPARVAGVSLDRRAAPAFRAALRPSEHFTAASLVWLVTTVLLLVLGLDYAGVELDEVVLGEPVLRLHPGTFGVFPPAGGTG